MITCTPIKKSWTWNYFHKLFWCSVFQLKPSTILALLWTVCSVFCLAISIFFGSDGGKGVRGWFERHPNKFKNGRHINLMQWHDLRLYSFIDCLDSSTNEIICSIFSTFLYPQWKFLIYIFLSSRTRFDDMAINKFRCWNKIKIDEKLPQFLDYGTLK